MSKMGQYVMELQEKEVEIDIAIREAKSLNMGNTVPTTTIIRQAARLAQCPVRDVIKFYYEGSQFDESTSW